MSFVVSQKNKETFLYEKYVDLITIPENGSYEISSQLFKILLIFLRLNCS